MSEQQLVKNCLAEICRKNGFTQPGQMSQREFEHISQELETKTGTLISTSTIRRLLNGEFSRIPQTATLNAVSAYLGFKNWQEYKLSVAGTIDETVPVNEKTSATPQRSLIIPFKSIASAAASVSLILFFSFIKSGSFVNPHYEKAKFSVAKTTNNDLPNTVVFNYDVTEVNADSFFIQQSWDISRRVKIDKSGHTLTDIYYEPGYHKAKLIANDSIIKTFDVSIPTDKWVYYVKEKSFSAKPQYVWPFVYFKSSMLAMSEEELRRSKIDIGKDNFYVMLNFPSQFMASTDNFIYTCRARVVNVVNSACPFLMVEVFGQRNFNYFISKPKGCAHEMMAQFGEKELNGKTTDLSPLAMNVNEWQDIEFSVINKTAHIKINGAEVYSVSYANSSGLITGFGFISNGLAQVDYAELKTPEGKVLYKDDFNK
jgi:hypothetical protein